MYVCYLIVSEETYHTYVGVTNNLRRRLRQHNGEIRGGAQATTKQGGTWSLEMLLGPFPTHQHALHLEWHWKHAAPKKLTGIKGRQVKILNLVKNKIKWPLKLYVRTEWPELFTDLPEHVTRVDSAEDIIFDIPYK